MCTRILSLACVVVSSFIPHLAEAQQVARYDYTDAKVAERLRPPLPSTPVRRPPRRDPSHPPPPPKPIPEEVGRGVCGGILGNPEIVVSISLDRDSYVFGDEFNFILQVKAVHPVRVPVRISIAEIEPTDASQTYKWRPMWINMDLRDKANREARIKLLQLYGSPDKPRSEIELQTGEWIEMRGKARMEWHGPPKHTPVPGYLIPVPLSHSQQFTVTTVEQRQGSFQYDAKARHEVQLCDYPAEWSASATPIHVMLTPKSPH